jgi:hypothetical protein
MYISYQVRRESKAPELTAHAKVISKTFKIIQTNTGDGSGDGRFGSPQSTTASHLVSFDFDNRRENFEVDIAQYNLVVENETGVLTYKEVGDKLIFVSFHIQS